VLCVLICLTKSSLSLQYSIRPSDVIRLRCSLDAKDEVIFQFEGQVYGEIESDNIQFLFRTIGMNIGRCIVKDRDGNYLLISREILLYLHPHTEKKLKTWLNPYTNKSINIVHIANDFVQIPFPNMNYNVTLSSTNPTSKPTTTYVSLEQTIPLKYPNSYYKNDSYLLYAPQEFYEAEEYFNFQCLLHDFQTHKVSIPSVSVLWNRASQFAPFMQMGQLAPKGRLHYTSVGYKLPMTSNHTQDVLALHPLLQHELRFRVPLYNHAPCHGGCGHELNTSLVRSMTSWEYFGQHLTEYIQGHEFPIPVNKSGVDSFCMCTGNGTDSLPGNYH